MKITYGKNGITIKYGKKEARIIEAMNDEEFNALIDSITEFTHAQRGSVVYVTLD